MTAVMISREVPDDAIPDLKHEATVFCVGSRRFTRGPETEAFEFLS